jgi:D-amino-acid dehydrogenase
MLAAGNPREHFVPMNVLVIGSGLIGVTTAYFLRRRGYQVTVLDRQQGPGRETSFANGGLLTPGMPEPWNAPGCWRVLLASLGRSDSELKLRLRPLPGLLGWGVAFLRNSSPALFERNTRSNLTLALLSLRLMASLRREAAMEYGGGAKGTLKIFRNAVELERAALAASRLLDKGLSFRKLARAETVALEPALAPIADQLAGAIYYPGDEFGDAHRFCVALADHARQQGVEFSFGTVVSGLERGSGRVTAVQTQAQRLVADQYVLAAGSYSTPLLRALGIALPVRPAKGYSVTFDLPQGVNPLKVPIVDDELHAAIVPFAAAIRVAGTAEFAGYDLALRPERVRNLLKLADRLLPRAGIDSGRARAWCGLRPMSADGVPIIGSTPIPNLWVNTGHGHLGWTMAAGSAQLLTELLCADPPSVEPAAFALARFL